VGVIIAIFSYLSIEMIAVAAGEPRTRSAPSPAPSAPPWCAWWCSTWPPRADAGHRALDAAGKDGSPFVKVMEIIGIPARPA
jgi:L-asparagine transporter-like permease